MMISADAAIERLKQGNSEFVANIREGATVADRAPPAELTQEQWPFAIILGCSDARVPAELVFNQGLGDLFVIRVAGNIVARSQIGSVEFAAAKFGTRLVVVLGHTQCGAVLTTLDELQRPTDTQSRNLKSIVNRVKPVVEPLLATELRSDPEALVMRAVRDNILRSVGLLQRGSDMLENMIQNDGLKVVAAQYSIETGQVDFFA